MWETGQKIFAPENSITFDPSTGDNSIINTERGRDGVSGHFGQDGMSGISGSFQSGWSGVSGHFGQDGVSGISGSFQSGWSGISGNFQSGWSGISGNFQSGWSGVSGNFQSGWSGISGNSGRSGISGNSGWSGISGNSGWSGISGNGNTVPHAIFSTTFESAGRFQSTNNSTGSATFNDGGVLLDSGNIAAIGGIPGWERLVWKTPETGSASAFDLFGSAANATVKFGCIASSIVGTPAVYGEAAVGIGYIDASPGALKFDQNFFGFYWGKDNTGSFNRVVSAAPSATPYIQPYSASFNQYQGKNLEAVWDGTSVKYYEEGVLVITHTASDTIQTLPNGILFTSTVGLMCAMVTNDQAIAGASNSNFTPPGNTATGAGSNTQLYLTAYTYERFPT